MKIIGEKIKPGALRAAIPATDQTPMINSVRGEPDRLAGILPIAAEHGCPVIALAMDDKVIAKTADQRLGAESEDV